jgi:hypothetical protein
METKQRNLRLAIWFLVVQRLTVMLTPLVCPLPATGQEGDTNVILVPGKDLTDARSVINALENHNPAPGREYNGDGYSPLFCKKYNWDEYRRVSKVIQFLKCHGEEAWPELLQHFDDKRYCITVGVNEYDSSRNCTVGDMCQQIVRDYLTAAYRRHISQLRVDEIQYYVLCAPAMLRKPEDLKAWCDKRKGKRLYELQIEMCEWAIEAARKLDAYRRPNAFAVAVRFEIDSLQTSRTAATYSLLRAPDGDTLPYTADYAEKIRRRMEEIGK